MGRSFAILVLLAVGSGVGCGGSSTGSTAPPPSFSGAPWLTVTDGGQGLILEVWTDPQPPIRGNLAVQYRLRYADGGSADGLALEVVPWMPAMGHGASVHPQISGGDGGLYTLTNVDLFMPGLWELRTHVQGAVTDDVAPQLQIP